jgi:PAS domain S-box-containing protein
MVDVASGGTTQGPAWFELALRVGRLIAWEVDLRTSAAHVEGDLGELLGLPDLRIDTLDAGLEVVVRDDVPAVQDMLRRAAGGEPAADAQFRLVRADGSTMWFEGRAVPVRAPTGEVLALRGVIVDIDARMQAEARLLAADRMASIGLLAAGIVHEINNPLAAVLGNLALAERRLAGAPSTTSSDDEQPIVLIRDAIAAADQMRQIVRDLGTLSRDSLGARRPLDLHALLDASIRMAWNELRHRARLVRAFDAVPPVRGDESRLGQVVLNLLVNAAQAIPEGRADAHEIRVACRRAGDHVVIEVRDTGEGMTPEVQRRLFTPFFTTKPPGVGTGLGLSICQRIVAEHGGRIEVRSTPGAGATFAVWLPLGGGAADAPALASPADDAPAAPRRRVLVVEDEPSVGAAVRRLLVGSHDVELTSDARGALRRLQGGEAFDVILCDLMMPELTGMDLHAALAATHPALADRVVFVSGGAFTPRARQFLERFPDRRLDKPFDLPRLLATIARVTKAGAAADAAASAAR